MNYLYSENYYIDLYDLRTIEKCLKWYWNIKDGFESHREDKEFKDYTKKKFDEDVHKVTSYSVNVISIERYRRKAETIREWMEKDRRLQQKFDNATPPEEIYCKDCFSRTKVLDKDLFDVLDENSKVLFTFECIKCKKKQGVYEDGTEWHYEKPKCPKCNAELHDRTTRDKKKDTLTTVTSCKQCKYKNKDVIDFKKSRKEREAREKRDKELLDTYRKEFCLDGKEGADAVQNMDAIRRFVEELKQQEVKDKNPVYQKAKQLKQLKIGQVKELLEKTIEPEGYKDLQFGKPDMGQHVVIDFTVNDMQEERDEYKSRNTLKNLIKKVLEDTTWRLMSDGISYRLGILSGKLKAYEREEDIVKLVGNTV